MATSPDLSATRDVEGVRYRLGGANSGWIITSRGYEGPVESLRTEHALHLVSARPDVIQYLALPVGHRFFRNRDAAVWFDNKVAAAR